MDDRWTIDASYIDPDDYDDRDLARRDAELEVLDEADPPRKYGRAVNTAHLDALARRPGQG